MIVGMRVVFLGCQQYRVRRAEGNDSITSRITWHQLRAVCASICNTHGTSAKESKVAGLSPVKYATSQSVRDVAIFAFRIIQSAQSYLKLT